jgi:hypothetical protein
VAKGYIGGYNNKNVKTPTIMEHSASTREEYELVMLHVNTIEQLEDISKENGDSYEFTIKSALAALKAQRQRKKNRYNYDTIRGVKKKK